MGRNQQIARQRLYPVDGGAQRRRHVGMRPIGEGPVRHRIQAGGEHHVHAGLAFARLPRPADAARRMARREDRRHRRIAQTHSLTVLDPPHIGNRRMLGNIGGLRIMGVDPARA
ncbi:hypothetical protein D3C81_2017360 [compost metagenome]